MIFKVLAVTTYFSFVLSQFRDNCETCVPTSQCPQFNSISRVDQEKWVNQFSCRNSQDDFLYLFGFPTVSSENYICCPSSKPRPEIQYNQVPASFGNFQAPQNPSGVFSNTNQCANLSLPPDPISGCCGKEEPKFRSSGGNQNFQIWQQPFTSLPSKQSRFTRFAGNVPIVTIANRISGGTATELNQFPWTVLLKTTFKIRQKLAAFNCGGSLISSKYVLTAGHCVTEQGGSIHEMKIYLAEYDKRTFPVDCVTEREGRKCIENVEMEAEKIIPHPDYENSRLQNDIAIIRLRGTASYNEYIRPICLPPINIDTSDLKDLPLFVAGWGRDGNHVSEIKQYTVVDLVPQAECKKQYPHLTIKHLCAAGYSGEDTCKGDSGGPLMLLYEGTYYVSGIVSGKRGDSPCGTSVPSLYTNVYHYIDWIRRNMKN